MTDLYRPKKGQRVPMPNGQDWPADGLPVNLASTYEARLVRDGDLVKVVEEQPVAAPASGRNK